MSSTKEKIRKAVFGKLRSLRRKLARLGIPCVYAKSVLFYEQGTAGFTISYEASGIDGEMTLRPHISIRTSEGTQDFDYLNFGQGLARIKELFQDQGDNTTRNAERQPSVAVEQAV